MNNKKILLIIVLGLFFIIPLIQWINEEIKSNKLKESKECYSRLIEVHYNDAVHGSAYGILEYQVNNKKYMLKDLGDYRMMKIGDTVLIKYADKDHSVARVTDKYYMRKYKMLKKKR